jgi:20S proteasome subunit beta 1
MPILDGQIALALAMSRDGSSGGVIRMCVITEDGVERLFVPGDQLPTFWEGKEVLGSTRVAPGKKLADDAMVVEA